MRREYQVNIEVEADKDKGNSHYRTLIRDRVENPNGFGGTQLRCGGINLVVSTEVELKDLPSWSTCHLCGGDVEGSNIEVDQTSAWQSVKCTRCTGHWVEVYTATHREQVER